MTLAECVEMACEGMVALGAVEVMDPADITPEAEGLEDRKNYRWGKGMVFVGTKDGTVVMPAQGLTQRQVGELLIAFDRLQREHEEAT